MDSPLPGLDVDDFLASSWQRRPGLIRGALADFDWPLDANDLAGLACEELVEARIITGPDDEGAWTLEHGPFDESRFDTLGDSRWTLLVQDVEKHYPPLARLLERFRFLPSWRIDDLMMSFAAPGGSVGPHVDQYDVFLCQVEGRRRWEISERFAPERRDDVPLDMLGAFEAEKGWDLEPGDILYLPPGIAHHGVALDACMTCSVGFRAPSAADLFLGLGEWLANQPGSEDRYTDPLLAPERSTGEIDAAALARFRELLTTSLTDDEALTRFIGQFVSRYRQAHDPMPVPGDVAGARLEATLNAARTRATNWAIHPWARFAWTRQEESAAQLFASGRNCSCSRAFAEWVCSGAGSLATPDARDFACLERLARDGQLIPTID